MLPRPLADAAPRLGLGLFAFLCAFEAGQRGFFAYDQSIVFDGGYRIYSGQVPYRDFLLWTGPVAYALQALFFGWLGVNYAAYLVSTAIFNVGATFLAVAVVRCVFPASPRLAYGAGMLTAIWFYPPFGTFAAEQTAFFFGLAALWLTLRIMRLDPGRRWAGPALAGGAGVLAFMAVLSKQHAGVYLLPLCPLVFLVGDAPGHRRAAVHCASFGLGFVVSLLAFWWWLWAASDAQRFVQYVLVLPGQLGWARLLRKGIGGLLKALLIGVGPRSIRPVVVGMELAAFLAAWRLLQSRNATRQPTPRWELVACLLCAYLTHFQHLLTYTMDNQSINGLPYLGVIVAMGLGLLRRAWPIWAPALRAVGAVSLGVPLLVGARVALAREVHEALAGAAFRTPIDVAAWKPLRWGQPTTLHRTAIHEADVVRLYRDLMRRGRNFFIFPDFTILYGLTGRPSPQPIVAFNKGLTYPLEPDPSLEAWIVEELERHQVEVVVIEEVSYRNAGDSRETLRDFPGLEAYLRTTFRESDRIGIFTIYEKQTAPARGVAAHPG